MAMFMYSSRLRSDMFASLSAFSLISAREMSAPRDARSFAVASPMSEAKLVIAICSNLSALTIDRNQISLTSLLTMDNRREVDIQGKCSRTTKEEGFRYQSSTDRPGFPPQCRKQASAFPVHPPKWIHFKNVYTKLLIRGHSQGAVQ